MIEDKAEDLGTGRSGGGDSGGGAYPNPHSGKKGGQGGPMGHGGQTDIDYHGPDHLGDDADADENPNAAAKGQDD